MTADQGWHRLTEAQAELWLAHCLDPQSPALSTAEYVEISAPVSLPALVSALRLVIGETESLRLVFATRDGEPRQRVGPAGQAGDVEVIDLSARADRDSAAGEAIAWMRAELAEPAVLDSTAQCDHTVGVSRNPLCRAAVFVLPGGDVLWYQRAHHIALDGYGVSLVAQRVATVYSQLSRGQLPDRLPDGGFARVLAADRQCRSGLGHQDDRAFWHGLLADVEPAVSLSERSASPAPAAIGVSGGLDAAGFARLTGAAKDRGLSWPDLLLSLQAAYLHKITGTATPTLGVAMMNRFARQLADVPAMVMNIAALPAPVVGESSVVALARQLAASRAQSAPHTGYRYEKLRRELRGSGSGQRLFGPLVNIIGFASGLRFGSSPARAHVLSTGPVDDINLTWRLAQPVGGAPSLRLDVEANPACYDERSLQLHRDRLIWLVAAASSLLDEPLATMSVLTPGERELVVRGWNDTARPVPATTLAALLAEQARRTPERTAVVFEDESLSYADLDARSSALAGVLVRRGARAGTVVAIAAPRSLGLVVGLVAILKSGAAYLPIDTGYPARRVEFMLADARPVCVLGPDDLQPDDLQLDGGLVAASFSPPAPDDAAYVIYTSGSTGRPKGVVVSHRAITNRLLWMQDEYRLTATDRVLQKTPSSFDVSVWEFFWPLISGASLVLAEPGGHQDPAYLSSLIEQHSISTAHFVPSMLRAFLDEPDSVRCASSLRQVMCSGEELPVDLAQRFLQQLPSVALHNLYGPTEAAVDVTYWRCGLDEAEVPIGRPVWNTRLYILDDLRQPVPIGVPGQLHLAGSQLAQGYLNRPELTAQRFVPDPFAADPIAATERMYATGDLASWRPDGAVRYLGRADDQVKVRGMRVELGEIEAALRGLAGVAAAAVALREDRAGDQRLAGYLVAEPAARLDLAAARAELALSLPGHMVPATLQLIDDIPLTHNGKLDRRGLPEPAGQAHVSALASTPRVELLCRVFADVLDVRRVGVDDNFFERGGHSLLAMTLARQVSRAFGTEVSVGTVFAAPTPAALASRLSETTDEQACGPLLRLRGGGRMPLWCVHPAGGLGWCYSGLLSVLPSDIPVTALQAPALTGGQQPASLRDLAAGYVDRLLRSQPSGPFQLLGWSVGGVIAHAMAVELSARGNEISLLALLDAYPADQWRDQPTPDEAELLRALLHIGGLDPAAFDDLSREQVIAALSEAGSALATLPPATIDAMADVVLTNNRLMRSHLHDVLDAGALFFTATAPRDEDWLDRDGWLPYLNGGLANVDLPCTHPAMMSPSMLAIIGEQVSSRLR